MERHNPPRKKNAYFKWYLNEGRSRFKREQGRDYDETSDEDKAIMTEYWQSVSPNVQNRRSYEPDNNKNGRNAYLPGQKAQQSNNLNNHRRSYEPQIRQSPASYNQNNTPEPRLPSTSNRISDPRLKAEVQMRASWEEHRRNISTTYRFKTLNFIDNVLDEKYTFISVICGYIYYDYDVLVAYPIPLEISFVNFTIRGGIYNSSTLHLDIHPNRILKDFSEDMISTIKAEIKRTANSCKIPSGKFSENDDDLRRAWTLFNDSWANNSGEKSKLLCNKEEYNGVISTLRVLAYSQINSKREWDVFDGQIKSKVISIEDFALGLKDATRSGIPDDKVANYFEAFVFPQNANCYCRIHANQQLNDRQRTSCPQAKSVMAIHKFYTFLFTEKYFKMDQIYQKDVHDICRGYRDATTSICDSFSNTTRDQPECSTTLASTAISSRKKALARDQIEMVLDEVLQESDDESNSSVMFWKIVSEEEILNDIKWAPKAGPHFDPFV